MYLCQQEKRALKSLVGALSLSSAVIKVARQLTRNQSTLLRCGQETMLDTLFEVFRVKTPDWFTQFVSGKRLTRKL